MSVTLLTVGFELPGHGADRRLRSDESILDGDVIFFDPDLSDYFAYPHPGGDPYILAGEDARLRRDLEHWREELGTALAAGKTVFVFLRAPQQMPPVRDAYGRETIGVSGALDSFFSSRGSGREPWSNYSALPVDLGRVVPRGGREIRTIGNARELGPYWREFGGDSVYEAYLDEPVGTPVLVTKTGSKTVGAIIPHGAGHLVLLPPLRYDLEAFFEQVRECGDDEDVDDCYDWTAEGRAYGARLIAGLLAIDRALRGDRSDTPPPEWAVEEQYWTPREADLLRERADVEHAAEALRERAAAVEEALEVEAALRHLLYGTGTALEQAILEALRAMGFAAERLATRGSEFDAIFTAEEGRFLGEAEGRDAKPVTVDKLDQLERNIREEFSHREDSGAYARGVLFANAHRLAPPSERGAYFTDKCLAAARRAGVALVRTPDLFPITRYLRSREDPEYARACRRALLETEGEIVQWPAVPE